MPTSNDKPKLTIGMACYDDFEGVWFTVTALRLYHAEQMDKVEIVVIDNNPGSTQGKFVRQFIENWVKNGRYVPFTDVIGTAAPRHHLFAEARGEAVLCMDSHVLLEPDAIRRLIDYYDQHPDCQDLLQGPLVYDDLQSYSSHFEDQWRSQMWGTWATDPRAQITREVSESIDPETGQRQVQVSVTENAPFEISAQGLGVFSCRKAAWLGFHPNFRGFGGEEFYIHEKYRQAGRRTLCLPFLRWVHRFSRPAGVPYPLTIENKLRNYVLGLSELGLPLTAALEHFSTMLSKQKIQQIVDEVQKPSRPREMLAEQPTPTQPDSIIPSHALTLPENGFTLTKAERLWLMDFVRQRNIKTVLEFGPGASTWCFVEAGCQVWSLEYDRRWYQHYANIFRHVPSVRIFHYENQPELFIAELERPHFDLGFVDSPIGKLYNRFSRLNACEFVAQRTDLWLLHDAQRAGEQNTLAVFQEKGWQFETVPQLPKLAVVTRSGTTGRADAPSSPAEKIPTVVAEFARIQKAIANLQPEKIPTVVAEFARIQKAIANLQPEKIPTVVAEFARIQKAIANLQPEKIPTVVAEFARIQKAIANLNSCEFSYQQRYDFSHWHTLPRVSCQCITFGRRELLDEAVESFLRQDYPGPKELVILNDYPDLLLECDLPNVRVINLPYRMKTIGEKRNACVALCQGDIIFPWDDDDIHLPHRISYSLQQMRNRRYFKSDRLWFWRNGEIAAQPHPAVAHAMSCWSVQFFDEVGGYPHVQSGQDAGLEERFTGPYRQVENTPPQWLYYIYRFPGTGSYHLSASGYGKGYTEAEQYVKRKNIQGIHRIQPHWKQNYLEMVKAILERSP